MSAGWLTPIPEQSPEDQAEKAFLPVNWALSEARRALEKVGNASRQQALVVGDVLAKCGAVSNLLWHWVATRRVADLCFDSGSLSGAAPEIVHTNRGMKLAWDMAIQELAELLDEDVSPENVRYELEKRGLL